MKWWEVRFAVPTEAAEAIAALLHEWPEIQGVSMEGGQRVEAPNPQFGEWVDELITDRDDTVISVYLPEYVDAGGVRARLADDLGRVQSAGLDTGAAMMTLTMTEMDESSWENAWKEDFRPIPIGNRLMIVPKWWMDQVDTEGRLPIILEPGMAFGTGTHPTTQLCLAGLEYIGMDGKSVLDVGCGTAVLSIAAAKLGARPVNAIDIDPVAVDSARQNVSDNDLNERVSVTQGDLLTGASSGTYDVIIANILRDIVIRLLPQAVERLSSGGRILVSGFIESQEADVTSAMARQGFTVDHRLQQEDWIALVGRLNS